MIAIYRYHAKQKDGTRFFFSSDPNIQQGWILDDVAFYSPRQHDPDVIPVYQFHHDQSQTYGGWRFYYTPQTNQSHQGWIYDNIAFYAYSSQKDNTTPIFKYSYKQQDGYRFHLSFGNKPAKQGWTFQKIDFYASKGLIE